MINPLRAFHEALNNQLSDYIARSNAGDVADILLTEITKLAKSLREPEPPALPEPEPEPEPEPPTLPEPEPEPEPPTLPEPEPEPEPEPPIADQLPQDLASRLTALLSGETLPGVEPVQPFEPEAHYGHRTTWALNSQGKAFTDCRTGVLHDSSGYGILDGVRISNCGDDGVKTVSGAGPLDMYDVFIHTLGRQAGAHADGIQDRGGAGMLRVDSTTIWMPTDVEAARSNSCAIFQPVLGPIPNPYFQDCILYGGNYTIYSRTKNGQGVAPIPVFVRCVFVVKEGVTPRYGLFSCERGVALDNCYLVTISEDNRILKVEPLTNDHPLAS